MFEKTVAKAFCGESFTAIATTDHLVHTFGLKPVTQHQVSSTRLVSLSNDNKALLFVYARSLNVLRPDSKQRVSLASEGDDLKIRYIYPVLDNRVLVFAERAVRESLNIKSSPNDDTVSQRSTVSAFQKHEPVNVADRFFKQVLKIGKIGAINF